MIKEGKAEVNQKYDRNQINWTAYHKKGKSIRRKRELGVYNSKQTTPLIGIDKRKNRKCLRYDFVWVYISSLSKTSAPLDCSGNPNEKFISQDRLWTVPPFWLRSVTRVKKKKKKEKKKNSGKNWGMRVTWNSGNEVYLKQGLHTKKESLTSHGRVTFRASHSQSSARYTNIIFFFSTISFVSWTAYSMKGEIEKSSVYLTFQYCWIYVFRFLYTLHQRNSETLMGVLFQSKCNI